ncbi:CAP domain-containing protein [Sphingomonas sp. Leaf339]|uniref:CAP domain-containing protein n=1 Tax=Sphingomonas sp. Leaf339 TaxID=1736343 RepID=UPI0009E68F64|nr:CAP domain-containing protein [Sphingomonas sp. Leaf339]
MSRLAISWLERVAVLALAPLIVGSTGLTSNADARLLAIHNRERATLGIPPLRWDPELAAGARQWADRLATTGTFQHAAENIAQPEGENLWAGTRGAFAIEAMIDAWLREGRYFKPGIFPNNSSTGRVADVDHYTQIMWRDTRAVGCAIARGAREDVLVCRYSQAGNYIGEKPF